MDHVTGAVVTEREKKWELVQIQVRDSNSYIFLFFFF